jgi:hypothetical protein
MTKVMYICRSPQTKALTYFIFFLVCFITFWFWAFRNKGSSKARKTFFQNKTSGIITKHVAFFCSAPPPPRLFCSIFFIAFFGVQENAIKKSRNFSAASLIYATFFLRRSLLRGPGAQKAPGLSIGLACCLCLICISRTCDNDDKRQGRTRRSSQNPPMSCLK